MKYLAPLRQLEWLDLSQNQNAGSGLAKLPTCEPLQKLDLSKTQFTDSAIESLARFPKLRELNVSDTQVTAQGLQKLRTMLPECDIAPKMPAGTRAVDRVFGRLAWAGQEPEWEGSLEIAALAGFHCRWSISGDSSEIRIAPSALAGISPDRSNQPQREAVANTTMPVKLRAGKQGQFILYQAGRPVGSRPHRNNWQPRRRHNAVTLWRDFLHQ